MPQSARKQNLGSQAQNNAGRWDQGTVEGRASGRRAAEFICEPASCGGDVMTEECVGTVGVGGEEVGRRALWPQLGLKALPIQDSPPGPPGKPEAAESRTPFLMWERPWGQVRVVVIFNMESSFSFVFWR